MTRSGAALVSVAAPEGTRAGRDASPVPLAGSGAATGVLVTTQQMSGTIGLARRP